MIVVESLALGCSASLARRRRSAAAIVAITHRTGVDYAALTGGGPSEISVRRAALVAAYSTRALALVDVARAALAPCS